MSLGRDQFTTRLSWRSCLICLLVNLLIFPPQIFADSISWVGGTGNYSSPANWNCATCSPPTYPNNGNDGLTFDATINSGGTDNVTLDVTAIVNSMGIGGSGGTSTLNVTGGHNLTFGTPSVLTGNVLNVGNGGVLNIQSGSSAILELSGGAGALVGTGGQINVQNGGTLTINNSNNAVPAIVANAGTISIGDGTGPATLTLNDSNATSIFTITTPVSGNGNIVLSDNAGNLINGASGHETLMLAGGTNLSGAGTISVSNFTNGGTLGASFTDNALIVSGNLTNWTAGTGTLSGGQYTASGILQLSSIGAGNSIQTLTNANIVLQGPSALITGDGTTNALAGLTNITDASLNLGSVGTSLNPFTITPGGGTLTMTSDPNGSSNLNLDQGSNVTVSGGFHNLTESDTASNTGTLSVQNGSTLTITGNLLNEADNTANLQNTNATINVLNGSTLNVDSLTTSTNNGFTNSNINVTGSSLNVTNNLLQGGGGPNFSSGDDTLTLTNSSATVGGNFQNNNGLNLSAVNLNNSSLMVDGSFTQTQGNGGFGQSQLNLTNNSNMTVGGFTNYNGVQGNGNTPQSLVSITDGSSLNIQGNGTFTNVTSGGLLSGGSYFVGTGSSLNYTGANINTIDVGTVLTLDNTDGGVQGAVLNGGSDAISNSLTTVNGTLALQNGTNLTLSGAPAGTFTVGSGGTLSLLNSSNLDVSAYNFTNVNSSGLLSGGSYVIGSNSTLNYSGVSDITVIDVNTSLTLDNANGGNTGSITNGGSDAISGTLTSVNGTLALQNGANLTLSGEPDGTFTVGANGTLSAINGSTFDVSAYNFTNVNSSGLLSGGSYFVGTNSTLNYSGPSNINTIDVNTSLTLDNINNGTTGMITNAGSDALSNSLTTNNGNLTLQNGANLALAQGLTNSSVDTLTGNGSANLTLSGSTLSLNGGGSDLTNIATSSNGNNATSTVALGTGANSTVSSLTVNNLYNTAVNTAGSFSGNATANINLTGGSSLQVNGNVNNTANGFNTSAAISLDGASTMTVGGTYSNTSGTLNLTNGSTATVAGLFSNDGNSSVNLDLTGSGGSMLTTNGGVSNAGYMVLDYFSTLNNTGTFSNSGTVNLYSVSQLTSTGLFDNTNGTLNLTGGGNTLYAAGFTNTGGTLLVAGGDTADFRTGGLDSFTNLSNGTLNAGAYNIGGAFYFDASAGTGGGQFQSINGASVTVNGNGQILYGANGSQGDALAAVTNMDLSTLSYNDAFSRTITPVGGTLTETDSYLNLSSSDTLTQTNLTVAGNLVVNSNVASGTLNLSGSNLTVNGSVTTSSNGSFDTSSINLNSAYLNNGVTNVLTGSTLSATGALYNGLNSSVNLNGGGNMLFAAGLTNSGSIAVGAGDTADFRTGALDTFTNLSNGTLTGGTLNVTGNFYYDASAGTGGGQILNMQGANVTLQGAGQILYGPNGSQGDALLSLTNLTDSNFTVDSLNASRTITPGGGMLTLAGSQFDVNSSTLTVAGSVVMNTDVNDNSSGISLSSGNLTVDGSITNNGSFDSQQTIGLNNLSTLTATGVLINDSTVNLNGGGNQLFATGFTNNGTINVSGGDTADFRNSGAGQLTNLSGSTLTGGTYNLGGKLFYDTGSDTSTYIQALNSANISLSNTGGGNAAGAILFGAGTGTDALAQLGTLTNSTLTLYGETRAFNPNGSNATFTLIGTDLDLEAYNTTPSALTIQGALQSINSDVSISGGSTLTVQGGVTIDSNSTISLNGGGNSLFGTSLTNNGALDVGAGDTADFRSGAGTLTNLSGNTLTGGTYNITGSLFYNTGSDASTYIRTLNNVNMTLGSTSSIGFGSTPTNALSQLGTLTNSNLTINGGSLAINPNGNGSVFTLDPSTLSLNGGTVLNFAGAVDNTAGSSVSLSGAGTMLTANGFTNDGNLTVGAGSVADFRNGGPTGSSTDTFTSLDGTTGTLNGTSYYIAGTFLFDPTSGTNGGNILNIGSSTTLTLDGSGGGAQVLYGPGSGTDALNSLNQVAGTLNLYNAETRGFTPTGGTLTVDSGATMNLGASFDGTGVANITGSLANAGTVNLDNTGSGLTTTGIFVNTGILNVNSSGIFVGSQGLSNTGGTINVADGATLDARVGGPTGSSTNTFSNLDGTTGTLGGGGIFNIGGSFLFDPSSGPTGGNILVIGTGTTLALTSSAAQVLYGPGSGINALASLTEIAGTLDLYNGATPTFTPNGGTLTVDSTGTVNLGGSFDGTGVANITGALTNNGIINLTNFGSGLTTTGSFMNTGTLNVNSSGDFVTSQGLNNAGGTINIANGAALDARTGGTNTFSNLDGITGTLGGGGIFNVGGSFLFDPSSGPAGGNIYVIGAGTTLALTSSGAQVLYGPGSGTDAIANLTEITGTLTLENSATHTFTPTTGTLTIDAPGTLNISGQYATATVTGSLANNGAVNINGVYGTFNGIGYDALDVSGALTNGSGGTLAMTSYDSVLNVGAGLTNNGTVNVGSQSNTVNVTGALANNNSFTMSGSQNVLNVTGDLTNAGTFAQIDGASTTANIGGNLNNLANGTYTVGYGNTTNVTLAANNAATGTINVNGNGTLAVTLGVANSGAINVGANAGSGTSNGLLSAGAPFVNQTGSALTIYNGSSVTAPGFTNNGTLSVLAGGLGNFQGGGAGSFTNLSGGTLTGGTYVIGGTFQFDSANGIINNIASGTSLTLDARNGGAYAVQSGTSNALLNLTGNAGSLTLTNGATLNTNTTANSGPGVFTNSGSFTTSGSANAIGANKFGVTGGFTNTSTGLVNLNYAGDSLTATDPFINQGGVGLAGHNASVSSAGFDNQATGTVTFTGTGNTITSSAASSNEGSFQMNGTGGMLSTGSFTNTGALTTAGGGSNTVNVTGSAFNTSPGVVNLNGTGDKMTASGQFTNTGAVTLNGNNAFVSSVGLDNQLGGTVTLAASSNSVSSGGTASNEGTIAFNGTNGSVSSMGDFTNAATGILTVTGTGNALSTEQNLFNSGAITLGGGGSLTAALGFNQLGGSVTIDSGGQLTVQTDTYNQTAGSTNVNTGGTLTASLFNLSGGTLTGGGTVVGNLTIDGGTLNPGDPQTIDIMGAYDQTATGLLDIDMAGPGMGNYDQVDVTGSATLGGTLDLTLENGFAASVGTVFDIFTWTTGPLAGNFNTFNDPTFNNGSETFSEVIQGNQVDLDVVAVNSSGAPAAPEPSTLSMLFCSMLIGGGVAWRIRRRRAKVVA